MTIDQAIESVQLAFPQVYFACHTRHARQRSSAAHLSTRDSAILVHLDRTDPTTLSDLARHLDLAQSTLSEALTKLERYGYVSKRSGREIDRRQVGLTLTAKGVAAVRASSVLEAGRLGAVLTRLSPRERAKAVNGLALLAKACRRSS